MLRIILAAVEPPLADAWEHFCGHLECVTIHRGSILDLSVDAVVSPANSFGFMDGGIDHLYSHFFGWHVQDRLQHAIRQRHHGELVVGTAEIVEIDHPQITYLIAAPTMRVPMILRDTVNPYLAARAALVLIRHGVFPDGSLAGEPDQPRCRDGRFPGARYRRWSGEPEHVRTAGTGRDRGGRPRRGRVPGDVGRGASEASASLYGSRSRSAARVNSGDAQLLRASERAHLSLTQTSSGLTRAR
jgi:hypothetical protein